jgi:DNA-binding transcriptional LysR family regulator
LDFRIRQLQCFLTLSDLLNYGKTARALYMTQPTITFQIKALEETFGVKLFVRDRQHVRLTEAGVAFREYARSILQTVDAAHEYLSGIHTRLRLRVSCGPVGQFVLLPAVLRTLARRHPEFELEVVELTTEQQILQLPDGEVDALIMVGELPMSAMHFECICEETLIVMLSERSPLACEETFSVQSLRDTPVIASRLKDCRFHQPFLRDLFAPFGIVPKIVESPQSCTVQFAYAAAGEGIALATKSLSRNLFPGLVSLPFRETLPKMRLGLATMRGNDSPALNIFRQVVLDCATKAFPNAMEHSVRAPVESKSIALMPKRAQAS